MSSGSPKYVYGSIGQVQRRGDSQKIVASIEAIGQKCDLALLNVDNEEFQEGFGENVGLIKLWISPRDDEEVLGYPTGGDSSSVTSGDVSRIKMLEYAQAGLHLLAMQINAAINAGNSGGGPIEDMDGNVGGVAFQSWESAENIGCVVPVPVVQNFLEDIQRNGDHTGFTSFDMRLPVLENESLRKSLGIQSAHSGVLVRWSTTRQAKTLYP
jgi:S1-C subfamily serine protease